MQPEEGTRAAREIREADLSPMKSGQAIPELLLLGGPLYRLGHRVGLVRGGTNTVWLGVALGPFAWVVLMLLAQVQGFGPVVHSLAATGIHVRLLVAVPLFFLCETWVVPQIAEFVRYIVRADLVEEVSLPVLAADVRRVVRMKKSAGAEILFLLVALGLPVLERFITVPGGTASWAAGLRVAGGRFTWTSVWYLMYCLPLIRFLLLRWLWTLGLWSYFIWRLEKLNLRLIAIHSDGAAGLGYLESVQERFAPLAAAISAILSAHFAEDIYVGKMAFESLFQAVPLVMLLNAVLFIGPLLILSRKLWICRWTGMSAYMTMVSRYVEAFDRKWIGAGKATGEDQLGTPDLQSLADLTNSVRIVSGMRLIPAGQGMMAKLAVAILLPLVPLLLLKYPADEVAARMFQILTGL